MSFARSGLPVAVWAPETTQSLEPAKQSSQMGLSRICWRARRSWGEVVLEFSRPTLGDETAKDGAPDFNGAPEIDGASELDTGAEVGVFRE
jgi:hypothetical protein